MESDTIPIALTIAGSDSGGGAGVQADLKTFHRFGVFGVSAVTAVTAQNTVGVHSIHPLPRAMVRDQIDAVATDLRPNAFKTGMVASKELALEICAGIERHTLEGYVMDPVMVATSGDRLLEEEAESALRELLLPRATLVTPNLPEARILTGFKIESVDGMISAARALVSLGAGAALVKGGHSDGDTIVDVLFDGVREQLYRHSRVESRNTHGTGCTLSAAIAAHLARGVPLAQATEASIGFVHAAIATAPDLGEGRGPVNHWARSNEAT